VTNNNPARIRTSVNRASLIPALKLFTALVGLYVAQSAAESVSTNTLPPISSVYGADGLRMNFQRAPLNLVMDYLSEAAGFIINQQAEVRGNLEVWSKQPVNKDEAVELLGSVLREHGFALTRSGRILTVLPMEQSKTADTEIKVSSDPRTVSKSPEVQTQIIPVRYATVTQLIANIQPLLPSTVTLSANESANTLILVATKTDIQRVLKIVTALDNSLASSASIRVVALHYARAKEMAELLTGIFGQQTTSQNGQAGLGTMPNFGGGPPGVDSPGSDMRAQAASPTPSGRGSTSGRLIAVADERSNSVIVSAPDDLLATAEKVVQSLDQPASELSELRVFRLLNADPSELADQLSQIFPEESGSDNRQAGDLPAFFPGPGPQLSTSTQSSSTSDRMKKIGRVTAVPDPRTSSLIITAAKSLMPAIAGMIKTLDADQGKREVVSYFELRNADPQDVTQNLQDLFNRSLGNNNNNQNTFLGKNHPLTQRMTQNQQSSAASSSSANTGSPAGGGSSRTGP
jgi:general secretion pathway protein D